MSITVPRIVEICANDAAEDRKTKSRIRNITDQGVDEKETVSKNSPLLQTSRTNTRCLSILWKRNYGAAFKGTREEIMGSRDHPLTRCTSQAQLRHKQKLL
jgi:hypothetical protein